jgi:hypothetical protein
MTDSEGVITMSGKQIARRWFDEVWNQRDATAISRYFAKDGIAHGLGANGEDLIGPNGFLPVLSENSAEVTIASRTIGCR